MKKHTLVLFLIFRMLTLSGQTDSLEKAALYSKLLAGEKKNEVFSADAMRWRKFIDGIGGYPDLTIDTNGKVHFDFSRQFDGMDHNYLFNRACEWLVINYGIVPSQTYTNREDGKIVLVNSLATSTGYDCSFTTIITIKHNILRTEFIGLSYSRFIEGHTDGDGDWVPERTIRFNIDQLYPVILKKQAEWKSNIEILRASKELLNNEILNLYDYVMFYDSMYNQ